VTVFALVPALFFAWIYISVHVANSLASWVLYAGYGTLQFTEVMWAVYFARDWKRTTAG
jgi:hypothetical protein